MATETEVLWDYGVAAAYKRNESGKEDVRLGYMGDGSKGWSSS